MTNSLPIHRDGRPIETREVDVCWPYESDEPDFSGAKIAIAFIDTREQGYVEDLGDDGKTVLAPLPTETLLANIETRDGRSYAGELVTFLNSHKAAIHELRIAEEGMGWIWVPDDPSRSVLDPGPGRYKFHVRGGRWATGHPKGDAEMTTEAAKTQIDTTIPVGLVYCTHLETTDTSDPAIVRIRARAEFMGLVMDDETYEMRASVESMPLDSTDGWKRLEATLVDALQAELDKVMGWLRTRNKGSFGFASTPAEHGPIAPTPSPFRPIPDGFAFKFENDGDGEED